MKKLLVALSLVVGIGGGIAVVRSRRPTVPEVPDKLGIFPTIPAEWRTAAELKDALADGDPKVRREAVRSLGRAMDHGTLSASEVVPVLLERVKDPDAGVRAVAVAYLRFPRVDPAQAAPVCAALLEDPDPVVRMNAAQCLYNHWRAAGDAVPALVEAWNDPSPDVRIHVSHALSYFPRARYRVPDRWSQLSPREATEGARGLGLSPSGSALGQAVDQNDAAGVYLLLKAGVDPNSRSSSPASETPLFRVGRNTRPEIVRFLLDAGADPRLKDKFGRSVSDWVSSAFSETRSSDPFGQESLEMIRTALAAP